MEIIEIQPQGFCNGVRRAVSIAEKTAEENPGKPITILGSLVHNAYVNDSLRKAGLNIVEKKGSDRLELLDSIDSGIVIFTAHGVSQAVRKKAEEKGLECIDASCPYVLATQNLINLKTDQGSTIFYIGKKGHPEAEGAISDHPGAILIETEDDLPDHVDGPLFVTNQTTMSVLDLQDLFQAIEKRFPQAQFCSEICTATRERQKAVMDLKDQNIDLLVVIGDPASNNTRKLSSTGLRAGIPNIIQIEDASELSASNLAGIRKAAVTSGASTPDFLRQDVMDRLHQLADQLEKPGENADEN